MGSNLYPASTASFFISRNFPTACGIVGTRLNRSCIGVLGCLNFLPIPFSYRPLSHHVGTHVSGLLLPIRLSVCKTLRSIQCQFANCGRILESGI